MPVLLLALLIVVPLVEIYTALVYQGPRAARDISEGLARLLARDGLSLGEAVGRDA